MQVDQTLVDAHLEPIPSLGTLTTGSLAGSDTQGLCKNKKGGIQCSRTSCNIHNCIQCNIMTLHSTALQHNVSSYNKSPELSHVDQHFNNAQGSLIHLENYSTTRVKEQ